MLYFLFFFHIMCTFVGCDQGVRFRNRVTRRIVAIGKMNSFHEENKEKNNKEANNIGPEVYCSQEYGK